MRKKGLFGITSAGLIAVSLSISWFVFAANVGLAANGSKSAAEMALNQETGTAYEVNGDESGALWISDYDADEIWQVDPVQGVYTIYQGIAAPSDARPDNSGAVWWGDADSNRFGRLSTTSVEKTLWEVPDIDGLYGTQIDQDGRFWATGFYEPLLFGFELQTTQLCTYTIPEIFSSDYLATNEDGVWLAGEYGNSIYMLDPQANQFTQWLLPKSGYPVGLAFDESGKLWWADQVLSYLASLDPKLDRLTTYDLPVDGLPLMIAIAGNEVWYTDDINNTVGWLDLTSAVSETFVLTPSQIQATPTCSILGPGVTSAVGVTSGATSFTPNSYPGTYYPEGGIVFDLPEGGAPWGITTDEQNVWFVDNGRQVLSSMPIKVTVTACKLEDADADLSTTDDQTPIEGWQVYLAVDGERQMPGVATGATGCTTWFDLQPGHNYGVEEETPSGWVSKTPPSHDFGTGNLGDNFSYTFINSQVEVSEIYLPLITR
jgi:streptogramin lyase